MNQLSLLELNRFVRRVMALNFGEAIWIEAELAQVQQSRGHYYLSLVQKDAQKVELLAQAEARLWSSQLPKLRRERGRKITELLQAGLQLRLRVQPVYHERFGYSLHIQDIDPDFTEGKLELARRQTIQQLQLSGDLDRNREQPLTVFPQRLAVISAESAAGFADFKQQLAKNEWGYAISIQLFAAAMQGELAPPEIIKRLREIARRASAFDAVIIIRGGGAKLDLLAFDNLELCQQIALYPLPVICGIGHEVDETVMDMVCHTSLKTPTAVATYLLDRAAQLEAYLQSSTQVLCGRIDQLIRAQEQLLQRHEHRLQLATKQQLLSAGQALHHQSNRIEVAARQQLKTAHQWLDTQEKVLEIVNPMAVLKRGYSLVSKAGQLVDSAAAVDKDETVEIRWADGSRLAIIDSSADK